MLHSYRQIKHTLLHFLKVLLLEYTKISALPMSYPQASQPLQELHQNDKNNYQQQNTDINNREYKNN